MTLLASILAVLVAALHAWFLILEMFLWQKPIGLKTFRNSPADAKTTAVLAANQGLYNGFLVAGLIASLVLPDPQTAHAFRVFFLSCVIVAGAYGAWTVNRRILFMQAGPAAVALALHLAARS